MKANRIELQVGDDGKIDLRSLPVKPGDTVEIVLLHGGSYKTATRTAESMRGSVLKFEDPLAPATDPDDWEAISDPDSVLNPNREKAS